MIKSKYGAALGESVSIDLLAERKEEDWEVANPSIHPPRAILNLNLDDLHKSKDPEDMKFQDKHGNINSFTENINSNNDTYFFVSVLRNK